MSGQLCNGCEIPEGYKCRMKNSGIKILECDKKCLEKNEDMKNDFLSPNKFGSFQRI